MLNRMRLIVSLLAIALTACKSQLYSPNRLSDANDMGASTAFSVSNEFPNPFADLFSNPSAPTNAELQGAQVLLERATVNVARRLRFAVFEPGATQITYSPLLANLTKELQAIDPSVRVIPSGGTVRAIWAYIADTVKREMDSNPKLTARDVLTSLASGDRQFKVSEVLGNGSDVDVLLKSDRPDALDKLKERANEVLDRAGGGRLKDVAMDESLLRMFQIRPDIKGYDEQMERTLRQGGSNLDHMGVDLVTGMLVEPRVDSRIAHKFVSGVYDYSPATHQAALEAPLSTLVRGFRPLLEMPFIRLSDEGAVEARNSMSEIRQRISGGMALDAHQLQQYAKLERNGRYYGAHNRFARSAEGTIEADFLKFTRDIEGKTGERYLHDFVDVLPVPPGGRSVGDMPRDLLMRVADFKARHTADGKLYHGTPSIDSGLAMLRGGMFISSDIQGAAAFGRGGYATQKYEEAYDYSQGEGLVFVLDFDPQVEKDVHILDWEAVKGNSWLESLQERAKAQGVDVFEVLGREYGIDIIVNHHVLVQNAAVLRFPSGLPDILRTIALQIENKQAPALVRASLVTNYTALEEFVRATGEKRVATVKRETLNEIKDTLLEDVRARNGDYPKTMEHLGAFEALDPKVIRDILISATKDATMASNAAGSAAKSLAGLKEGVGEVNVALKNMLLTATHERSFDAANALAARVATEAWIFDFVIDNAEKIGFMFGNVVQTLHEADPALFSKADKLQRVLDYLVSTKDPTKPMLALAETSADPRIIRGAGLAFLAKIPQDVGNKEATIQRADLAVVLLRLGVTDKTIVRAAMDVLKIDGIAGVYSRVLPALAVLDQPPDFVITELHEFRERLSIQAEKLVFMKKQVVQTNALIQLFDQREKQGPRHEAAMPSSVASGACSRLAGQFSEIKRQ